MNKNNNWIMLAIVCGIIAYAYMQRKKPALVFPLPSFKESFEDIKPEDYRFAWNISRANIFKKRYPRHKKAINELLKQGPPGLGQRYNEIIIKTNKDLISVLEKGFGVKFTQAELSKMLRQPMGKAQMAKPPMAKQVVVANGQAIAQLRELSSGDINLPKDTFDQIEKACNQGQLMYIIGNGPKLTTKQRIAAKNTCILQTAAANASDKKSQDKLLDVLKQGIYTEIKN